MANKKITVLGDAGDSSLTPEEEQRIESKIDKMLAMDQPDQTDQPAKSTPPPETTEQTIASKASLSPAGVPDTPLHNDESSVDSITPPPATSLKLERKVIMPIHDDLPSPAPQVFKPKSIPISSHDTDATVDAEVPPRALDTTPSVVKSAPPLPAVKESAKPPKTAKKILVIAHDSDNPEPDSVKAVTSTTTDPEPTRSKKTSTKKPAVAKQKPAKKPVATIPAATPEAIDLTAAELPRTPLKIHINQPELEIMPVLPVVEDQETTPETTADKTDDQPQANDPVTITTDERTVSSAEITEPLAQAVETPDFEETTDDIDLLKTPIGSADTTPAPPNDFTEKTTKPATSDGLAKKYRPPDGPMQFKRAAPVDAMAATSPASELQSLQAEDAAIAKAFEAKEEKTSTALGQSLGVVVHSRVLKLLIVLLVVAGLAFVAYKQPRLHRKLDSLLGHKILTSDTPSHPATSATPSPITNPPVTFTGLDLFIAKQSGTYNVYKLAAGSQQRQLVLSGTGYEDGNFSLVPNADGSRAGLVSTRDNQKDAAGYRLQTLTLIHVASGDASSLAQAQNLQIIGWFGDKLVYVTAKTAASISDSTAYQLLSYDATTKQTKLLDQANHFNDVLAADGALYYATSTPNGTGSQLIKISPDGSNKQVILATQVFNIYRVDYKTLALATAKTWYTMQLGDSKPTPTTNAYTGKSQLFIDSPDGKQSVRIDGLTNTLYLYNVATNKETSLLQQAGLGYPVRWLDNSTLVYRMTTSQQTADYRLAITGGPATKITDVAVASGQSLWQ